MTPTPHSTSVRGLTWLLAVAFIVCRILHGVFYLADLPLARSAAWTGGMACVASLLVLAALNVA